MEQEQSQRAAELAQEPGPLPDLGSMQRLPGSTGCIICGRDNPVGMNARFHHDGENVWTQVTPAEHFQGFNGILHGGLISALLDDVMWYACYTKGLFTLTGELTVRFKRPITTGQPIIARGQVENRRGRVILTRGEVRDAAGTILAEATAKFIEAPEGMRAELSRGVAES